MGNSFWYGQRSPDPENEFKNTFPVTSPHRSVKFVVRVKHLASQAAPENLSLTLEDDHESSISRILWYTLL